MYSAKASQLAGQRRMHRASTAIVIMGAIDIPRRSTCISNRAEALSQHTPEKPSMARRPFHFSAKGVKGPTERESGFSPALHQPHLNRLPPGSSGLLILAQNMCMAQQSLGCRQSSGQLDPALGLHTFQPSISDGIAERLFRKGV